MDRLTKILVLFVAVMVFLSMLNGFVQSYTIGKLEKQYLNERLKAKSDSIVSLKKDISKRNQLIEQLYEELRDTLDGVDNAPVSASHSAIIDYLNGRK